LRAVATYLDRHGHHQGGYYDRTDTRTPATPPACVLGGIGIVVHGTAEPFPEGFDLPGAADFAAARAVLIDYLVANGELHPHNDDLIDDLAVDIAGDVCGDLSGPCDLPEWNDDPWRTAIDVTLACLNAADAYDRAHTIGGAA
jgi:hypothetical protein